MIIVANASKTTRLSVECLPATITDPSAFKRKEDAVASIEWCGTLEAMRVNVPEGVIRSIGEE